MIDTAAATAAAGTRDDFYFLFLPLDALPGVLFLALELEGPVASPFIDGEGDVPALLA